MTDYKDGKEEIRRPRDELNVTVALKKGDLISPSITDIEIVRVLDRIRNALIDSISLRPVRGNQK